MSSAFLMIIPQCLRTRAAGAPLLMHTLGVTVRSAPARPHRPTSRCVTAGACPPTALPTTSNRWLGSGWPHAPSSASSSNARSPSMGGGKLRLLAPTRQVPTGPCPVGTTIFARTKQRTTHPQPELCLRYTSTGRGASGPGLAAPM